MDAQKRSRVTANSQRRLTGLGRRRTGLLVPVALLCAAVVIGACGAGAPKRLPRRASVPQPAAPAATHPSADIVLVTIDDRSFRDLGLRWPFPRRLDGQLLKAIAAEHPRAVAFDVQLDRTSAFGIHDDIALLHALSADHNRVGRLMIFAYDQPATTGHVPFLGSANGTQLLHQVGARLASDNLPADAGGVVRQTVYAVEGRKSLDVVTAEVASYRTVSPDEFDHGRAPIHYRGPAGTFPSVSYSTVVGYSGQPVAERLAPDFFKGKIVVVGATAPGVADFHATPDGQMSGVEINANAIDSLLAQSP